MSTYKPGTIAVATVRGVPNVRVMRRGVDSEFAWASATAVASWYGHRDSHVTDVRPLVTLDPAILGDVAFIVRRLRAAGFTMIAETIEAQTKPPKPEVYEHLLKGLHDGMARSHCGKVWRPSMDVTVVGKCPECREVAETSGWSA